jgi:hypothetical protein
MHNKSKRYYRRAEFLDGKWSISGTSSEVGSRGNFPAIVLLYPVGTRTICFSDSQTGILSRTHDRCPLRGALIINLGLLIKENIISRRVIYIVSFIYFPSLFYIH